MAVRSLDLHTGEQKGGYSVQRRGTYPEKLLLVDDDLTLLDTLAYNLRSAGYHVVRRLTEP